MGRDQVFCWMLDASMTTTGLRPLLALALDAGLGAAAVLVAIVSVITSVILWRRSRQRKTISYRLTTARVVSVRREASDRISVLYDGAPVGDVRLLDLHVECSGNVAIASSDFDHPFTVRLGAGAQALSSAVTSRSPPDLDVQISLDENSLSIEPLLLNQGDSFAVTALVSDLRDGVIGLDGRVAGVPRFINLDTYAKPAGLIAAALSLDSAAIVVIAPLGLLVGGIGGVASLHVLLVGAGHRASNETEVVTKRRTKVCGHIINSDQQTLTMRLNGSGDVRQLRIAEVQAIHEDAC